MEESIFNSNDDFLTREILSTHNFDSTYQLQDCPILITSIEATFSTQNHVFDPRNIDATGSSEEPISLTIYKIANEIHYQCHEDANLHKKTVALLELLSHYRWDAKVVLAIASFARRFASFRLILQLQPDSVLAASLATVQHLPKEISSLNSKALNMLVKTMLNLAKIIVQFEGFSPHHPLVENRALDTARKKICIATYWVLRSVLVCSSQFPDLRPNLSHEQVSSDRSVIAAWSLHSLGKKLDSFCRDLGKDVENCRNQMETKLYEKLLHLFKEKQDDNQTALRSLFDSEDEFPFNNGYSRDKVGFLKVKSKTVLLLISPSHLFPLEKALFLVQQTKTEENCVVIWVPVASADEWSLEDRKNFEFFSKRLPWFSVRKPWQVSSGVVKFIGKEWRFKEEPIMVALNKGEVVNAEAMDMVWIWGSKAFPFSSSRETHLWEQANWCTDLLISGLMPNHVKEGRSLCIYGSDSIDWVKEFNQTINKMKTDGGLHDLQTLYVGCKNLDENVKNIIRSIDQETTSLSFNNMHLFWARLESIKRSIFRASNGHEIAARVTELLDTNGKGWAVIGDGSSNGAIKLDLEKIRECAERLCLWSRNVGQMGLVRAVREAIGEYEGDGKCKHGEEMPYEDGLIEKVVICGSCRQPIHKFVLYKCDE